MFNIFKKKQIDETLEEQKADILKIHPELAELCVKGEDCDEIPTAVGEFGMVSTNPIPVNGPLGEIKYINRLRNKDGFKFLFHRLGPIAKENSNWSIDVYELVSLDGKTWGILYLDMYHPRRSIKVPGSYKFSKYDELHDRLPVGFGTNHRDPRFPFSISKFIEKDYDIFGTGIFNKRLAEHCDEFLKDKEKFIRPESHKAKIADILKLLKPVAYYQPDIDILNFDLSDVSQFNKKLTEQEAVSYFILSVIKEAQDKWPTIHKALIDSFKDKFVVEDEKRAPFDLALAAIAQDLQAVQNLFPKDQAERIEKSVLKCVDMEGWGKYPSDEIKKYRDEFQHVLQNIKTDGDPLMSIPEHLLQQWLGKNIQNFKMEIGGEKTGFIEPLILSMIFVTLSGFSPIWKKLKDNL